MKPTAASPGVSLVWLRRDLRLADNPALQAAANTGKVIPVFIWDDDQPWPLGAASKWWLHQSLAALQEALEAAGSRLILRQGPSIETLLAVAKETGAEGVYWNRRYEPALIEKDREAKQRLREAGLHAESLSGNLLFEPWTIQNKSGKPFQVFTSFWKTLGQQDVAKPLGVPELDAPEKWPQSLPLGAFQLEPTIGWAAGLFETWKPGEAGAQQHLKRFAQHASAYTAERDLPDREGTSLLSPHLAFGEITPRQIWHGIGEEPYRRQIAWREFAHHLLFHFPKTPDEPLREGFARFPWTMDPKLYRAWRKGQTGYPIVDAGMRQLWHTGWMHNRVRMVVASFLVKDLLISWQEGAQWFWDTLVDADLANNTLGWQWVAGCGADAAPYFRIFNPVLQGEKFDPTGGYVRRWVPELAGVPNKWIHKPWESPDAIPGYPQPVVNHDEARTRALAALASLKR